MEGITSEELGVLMQEFSGGEKAAYLRVNGYNHQSPGVVASLVRIRRRVRSSGPHYFSPEQRKFNWKSFAEIVEPRCALYRSLVATVRRISAHCALINNYAQKELIPRTALSFGSSFGLAGNDSCFCVF